MSLLGSIVKGRQCLPRRVMVYGVQGIGKSTFGAMAPKPIFIQTEEGSNDIECDRFPLANSLEEVKQQMATLYTEPHDYQSVVVDTLDAGEPLIWAAVVEEYGQAKGIKTIEEFGFNKGYHYAVAKWRELFRGLQALRDDRGMMIILLAHSTVQRFENPETSGYDRYMPKLHKFAAALIQEWCDEVLFASYRVYTKAEDKGFNQKVTKGLGAGERILRTEERPAHLAKNRLSLPYELPLNFQEFAKHLPTNSNNVTNRKD